MLQQFSAALPAIIIKHGPLIRVNRAPLKRAKTHVDLRAGDEVGLLALHRLRLQLRGNPPNIQAAVNRQFNPLPPQPQNAYPPYQPAANAFQQEEVPIINNQFYDDDDDYKYS